MRSDLVSHWQSLIPADWIVGPWEEAHDRCWRCWEPGGLQRCHLVPASRGGPDAPANLILLCSRCHLEQPNVTSPEATWQWLRASLHSGYLRRHAEWHDAYEQAYGEAPGADVVDPEGIGARLSAELAKAVTHWGERGLNPATMAACVRKAEGKL